MRIDITPAASDAAALHEPDDFKGFSVLVRGDGAADAALGRLGRVDGDDHVFVDPAVVKGLAGERAQDPSWLASFDAMVAFAGEHGWLDDAGFVRAHVERAG